MVNSELDEFIQKLHADDIERARRMTGSEKMRMGGDLLTMRAGGRWRAFATKIPASQSGMRWKSFGGGYELRKNRARRNPQVPCG